MIEAVDNLRSESLKFAPNIRRKVNMALNEIEQEIAERYMELPRLDDGVINAGDWIESDYGEFKCVREVEALIWDGERWDFQLSDEDGDTRNCASIDDFYECSRHIAKHDKLRELLEEFGERVARSGHQYGLDAPGIIGEFEPMFRELMEEGGDD